MTDVLFIGTGDLSFINGDLIYGESTRQHQADLLLSRKGDYKAVPDVGIEDFLKDETPNDLLTEISREFNKDGMNVSQLSYVNGILNIIAVYGS